MHNFKVGTHVNLQRVNKLETLYGRSRFYTQKSNFYVYVWPNCLSYIALVSFSAGKFYVHWQGEI